MKAAQGAGIDPDDSVVVLSPGPEAMLTFERRGTCIKPVIAFD